MAALGSVLITWLTLFSWLKYASPRGRVRYQCHAKFQFLMLFVNIFIDRLIILNLVNLKRFLKIRLKRPEIRGPKSIDENIFVLVKRTKTCNIAWHCWKKTNPDNFIWGKNKLIISGYSLSCVAGGGVFNMSKSVSLRIGSRVATRITRGTPRCRPKSPPNHSEAWKLANDCSGILG